MPRNRVLSFMSQFGSKSPSSNISEKYSNQSPTRDGGRDNRLSKNRPTPIDTQISQSNEQKHDFQAASSPKSPTVQSRARADSRANGRPNSMIQTWQPPQMDLANDTPPELQPIFSYLNSHSNKLYQEGYFLKLHDLDSRGRPSQDRTWNECFAQLVGTVLSLWDAAALDAAGEDGEVMPTFINLSDASLKMIESLPMNGSQGDTLQNVLSISTAANNRYLLHFNSLNSLTQWTAGIRLAIFEHSTLQEAYTGSIIAGKGKYLNNIKQIMERSRFVYEDWARVRFGAGTPWKRCWCVISPPDEKEYAKAYKLMKKGGSYSRLQLPKGDIKFYDTRRVTKKTRPIATITDAYAAYAVYPQSKPLIDQSTLVKLEGLVTVHSSPATTAEGFVFVMPEVHPAVSGFEMMLRWLFPVYDTFCLYGRPVRLIADTLDQRGLMFAMPRDRRYGYLDILDVSGAIHTKGSQKWTERQWRSELKKLTSQRMTTQLESGPGDAQLSRRSAGSRTSLPPPGRGLRFDDAPIHSTPGSRSASPVPLSAAERTPARRTDSAPSQVAQLSAHKRSASDARAYRSSRLSHEASRPDEDEVAPLPPAHGVLPIRAPQSYVPVSSDYVLDEKDQGYSVSYSNEETLPPVSPYLPPPQPVVEPPAFTHSANSRPATRPNQAPDLRRAHSTVDADTLNEMRNAVRTENGNVSHQQQLPLGYSSEGVPFRTIAREDRSQSPAGRVPEVVNVSSREAKRLSTIPASPYVGDGSEYFTSVQQTMLPQHAEERNVDERPPMVPRHSSNSIMRKPVPKPPHGQAAGGASASQVRSDESPSPVSRSGSFVGALIDKDALERILDDSWERTDTLSTQVSTVPDYASTAPDPVDEVEVEKPRAGKLKTVGDPDLPTADPRSGGVGRFDTYNRDNAAMVADLPSIDFGPTFSYKPNPRPKSAMDIGRRSSSGDRLRNISQERLSTFVPRTPTGLPGDERRQSYFGGRTTPAGIEPNETSTNRNSVAWTPGGGSPGPVTQEMTSLTPEEWVQYRASMANRPMTNLRRASPSYAHQRTDSAGSAQTLRQSMSKTPPPFARQNSGDWTQLRSSTPNSRPHSRGASQVLSSTRPVTPSFTAQEQMYIARATGGPLLSMDNGAKVIQTPASPGLIGALAAREREKEAIKEGLRSSAVQNAIAARQQEQFMQQQQQYMLQQQQQQQQLQMNRYSQQFSQSPVDYQQATNQQAALAAAQSVYGAYATPARSVAHGRSSSRMSFAPSVYIPPSPGAQPMQQPQYAPQAGGFGGAYVQQQGMSGQQSIAPGSVYGQRQQPAQRPQSYIGSDVYQQQQAAQWVDRR